jgi:hypothetical protein
MVTAEGMVMSIRIEGQGIFVLLWDAKDDLVRALVVINAALNDVPMRSLILTPGEAALHALRSLIETRVVIGASEADDDRESREAARELWCLYLPQASSALVGPWLNGWRGPLRQAPGTILVIRHADFEPFQRHAPDLASFIGPRIYNASTMLSLASTRTLKLLVPHVADVETKILAELPGAMPKESELRKWIASCVPADAD